MQELRDLLGGRHDVRYVRVTCLAQRGRHAYRYGIAFGQGREVVGSQQVPGSNQRLDALRGYILDVREPAIDRIDLGGVNIDTHDCIARLGKGNGEGQTYVSEADYAHARIARFQFA